MSFLSDQQYATICPDANETEFQTRSNGLCSLFPTFNEALAEAKRDRHVHKISYGIHPHRIILWRYCVLWSSRDIWIYFSDNTYRDLDDETRRKTNYNYRAHKTGLFFISVKQTYTMFFYIFPETEPETSNVDNDDAETQFNDTNTPSDTEVRTYFHTFNPIPPRLNFGFVSDPPIQGCEPPPPEACMRVCHSTDMCPICQVPESPTDRINGACGHLFHPGCLVAWTSSGNRTCPACRQGLLSK